MTLDAATLFCSRCGRLVDVAPDILEALKRRHRLSEAPNDVAGVLKLLSSLKCSACQMRSPVLRAYVDGALYPFTEADLSRCCLSCGDTLSPPRVAACPLATLCVACIEASELAPLPPQPVLAICKRCGRPMKPRFTKRVVPLRYFLGCSRFPACTYTQAMPDPG